MISIVVVGGGGHAKVCIELLERIGTHRIVGVVDPKLMRDTVFRGYPVLGSDDVLPQLRRDGVVAACVGIGGAPNLLPRRRITEQALALGFDVPTLIHPSAIVARDVALALGAQVMAGVILQPGAAIGAHTIINTGATIDHDSVIGAYGHVCPGVTISGGCTVGDGAFIGVGARVIHGIRVGTDAIIAAGAVVIRDVLDGATVMGVPARVRVRTPVPV